MSPRSILALLTAVVLSLPAVRVAAYESGCRHDWDDPCDSEDGYAAPRARWLGDDAEHHAMFEYAAAASGLPEGLFASVTPVRYTDDALIATVGDPPEEVRSWMPQRWDAAAVRTPGTSAAEMSQLPDFSWALWDWASGNQLCPPFPWWDAGDCHVFKTHMGALNSSHFPPQSESFYAWYHDLAMARAAECRAMLADLLGGADPPDRCQAPVVVGAGDAVDRLGHHVQACEQEAMLLEGVAQHYLQDTWSMGHMWHRWGGPEIDDWLIEPDWTNPRAVAAVVGALSGTMHGAKSMLDPLLPGTWDDAMCAPLADRSTTYYDPVVGAPLEGLGDMFGHYLYTDPLDFAIQLESITGCSVDGMRAVYAESGCLHGPIEEADAAVADLDRPLEPGGCFGQRATNGALFSAFGLHFGEYPDQDHWFEPSIWGANALVAVTLDTAVSLQVEPTTDEQEDAFRHDVGRLATQIAVEAFFNPDDTNLASGGLHPVIGVQHNGAYAAPPGDRPASWTDPPLPWGIGGLDNDGQRAEFLNLGFAEAHAADRCDTLSEDDLYAYFQAVWLAPGAERAARCGQCVQMVAPHFRFGSPDDHDLDREPLCHYTATDPAFVYSWDPMPGLSAEAGATAWCDCAGGLLVATGDAPDGGLVAQFDGDPWPAIDAQAPEPLTLGLSDRGLAMAASPTWDQLVTVQEDGTLSLFDLTPGEEQELDADFDPATTDVGAAPGITRLVVGGRPADVQAFELDGTARALVASWEHVSLVDLDARQVEATVTRETLGLPDDHRLRSVEVSAELGKAWIGVIRYGLGEMVWSIAVLDLPALAAGITDSSVLLDTLAPGPTDCPAVDLALSPDGSMLAVGCNTTAGGRIFLFEAATDAVIDMAPTETWDDLRPFAMSRSGPSGLAWTPDGEALHVLWGLGRETGDFPWDSVLRRCPLDEYNCWLEVKVSDGGPPATDLVVVEDGDDTVSWVIDGSGWLVAVPQSVLELEGGGGLCVEVLSDAWDCPPVYDLGFGGFHAVTAL